MSNESVYYHILEHGNGEIGYQGYEMSEDAAWASINHLTECFPDVSFEIYPSNDSEEPPIVTI